MLKSFANANDWLKTLFKSFECAKVNSLGCLAEICSSFAVADNYIFNAKLKEHICRNLACKSTAVLKVNIFGTDFNV